jgi:hypothetical protein
VCIGNGSSPADDDVDEGFLMVPDGSGAESAPFCAVICTLLCKSCTLSCSKGADSAWFMLSKGARLAPFLSSKGATSAPFDVFSVSCSPDSTVKGAESALFSSSMGAGLAPFSSSKGAISAPFNQSGLIRYSRAFPRPPPSLATNSNQPDSTILRS